MVEPYDAAVFDIEGTILPISFVKDVLFPYAYNHYEEYITAHYNDDAVKEIMDGIRLLAKEHHSTGDASIRLVSDEQQSAIRDAVHNLKYWTEQDKKLFPLKRLQGLIWTSGFEKGSYKAPIYPDVIPAMKLLAADIYTYSSGSRQAQTDCLQYCEGPTNAYFLVKEKFSLNDIGPKREKASYVKLAEAINRPAGKILFVTDVIEEADAAKEAGIRAALMVRPGNAPLPARAAAEYDVIYNTTGIFTEDEIDRLNRTKECAEVTLLQQFLRTCRQPTDQ